MAKDNGAERGAERQPAQGGVFDALVIGAGFSGLYQLLLPARPARPVGAGAGSGRRRRRHLVLEPLSRVRAAIRKATPTATASPRSCCATGNGPSAIPSSPRSCATSTIVADRFDLKRDIRFGTRVTAAHYDEAANRWHVSTETGERLTAQVPDHRRRLPLHRQRAEHSRVSRASRAAGYHTGQWPHEGVDFTGKRVGMIGTGSTGIQAAPVIAETAAHLTVFQRTANYSVPARNVPLTPEFRRYVKENIAEHPAG